MSNQYNTQILGNEVYYKTYSNVDVIFNRIKHFLCQITVQLQIRRIINSLGYHVGVLSFKITTHFYGELFVLVQRLSNRQ